MKSSQCKTWTRKDGISYCTKATMNDCLLRDRKCAKDETFWFEKWNFIMRDLFGQGKYISPGGGGGVVKKGWNLYGWVFLDNFGALTTKIDVIRRISGAFCLVFTKKPRFRQKDENAKIEWSFRVIDNYLQINKTNIKKYTFSIKITYSITSSHVTALFWSMFHRE